MPRAADIHPVEASLRFVQVVTRLPLKFGRETVTDVTWARACVKVADCGGRTAEGWAEGPLCVQWVWPSDLPYDERHEALRRFSRRLIRAWSGFRETGHPIEVGHAFQEQVLPGLWKETNRARGEGREPMPWLAALVCVAPFDNAMHDAYGVLLGRPVYETYTREFMNADLAHFLEGERGVSFQGKYPADFLVRPPAGTLEAWHLVGGKDPLEPADLRGDEPRDGHPVLLRDWIRRDGLKCLKVKLCGVDVRWDFDRLDRVGRAAIEEEVPALSADFNCTVTEPAYVNDILDRLRAERPQIFDRILYVEQPFPYEIEQHRIDVRSVSSRKPLFLDERAHDWKHVRLGRSLGWTGVALKTCKTQTGALLSLCWARAHGMPLMVQDSTNSMLAQIPHVLLAAHAGTIRGVETNAVQFYPDAGRAEAQVHPGLYARRHGRIDLATVRGPGFGYRLAEIPRDYRTDGEPAPALE